MFEEHKQVAMVPPGEKPPWGRGKCDPVWYEFQLRKWWLAGSMFQLRVKKNFLTPRANHSLTRSFTHLSIHSVIYLLSSTYSMLDTVYKAMGNVEMNETHVS